MELVELQTLMKTSCWNHNIPRRKVEYWVIGRYSAWFWAYSYLQNKINICAAASKGKCCGCVQTQHRSDDRKSMWTKERGRPHGKTPLPAHAILYALLRMLKPDPKAAAMSSTDSFKECLIYTAALLVCSPSTWHCCWKYCFYGNRQCHIPLHTHPHAHLP